MLFLFIVHMFTKMLTIDKKEWICD